MNKDRGGSVFSEFHSKEIDFDKEKNSGIFEPLGDKDELEPANNYNINSLQNSEIKNLKNEKISNKGSSFQ